MRQKHTRICTGFTRAIIAMMLTIPVGAHAQSTKQVLELKKEIRFLSVSPDGQLLTYAVRHKEESYHFLYYLDLTVRRPKPKKVSPGLAATFSPDGESLVYYNDAKGDNKYWLTLINRKGNNATDLGVASIAPDSIVPTFNPQGSQILYGTAQGTFLIPPEGKVTELVSHAMFNRPRWFPDGKSILYERQGGGISILNLESGDADTITPDFKGFHGDVSPDGTHIVLSYDGKIYQFEVATKDHEKIAEAEKAIYSPDGRGLLLFRSLGTMTKGDVVERPDYELVFMPFDGSDEIRVATKAHDAVFASDAYTIYVTVHWDGIYRVVLPGEPEPVEPEPVEPEPVEPEPVEEPQPTK